MPNYKNNWKRHYNDRKVVIFNTEREGRGNSKGGFKLKDFINEIKKTWKCAMNELFEKQEIEKELTLQESQAEIKKEFKEKNL